MLVNCSQDRKGEDSPFHGYWQSLVLVLVMLTGCLIRAAGALLLGKVRAEGDPENQRSVHSCSPPIAHLKGP